MKSESIRLADFIEQSQDKILKQWELFAATLLPAAGLKQLELRDHAPEMLAAVAKDLRKSQTRKAQEEKSQGQATALAGATETAAHTHALLRAKIGFSIEQLVAEYRALRASVLRLWIDETDQLTTDIEDMLRFNEAIDQSIAESVSAFSQHVNMARDLLLGTIVHDMRTPLQTIQLTASYLAQSKGSTGIPQAAERLIQSGSMMHSLIDDLVDYNRTHLGSGIRIDRKTHDLALTMRSGVEQLRAAYPDRLLEYAATGNALGAWDGARLERVLSNLVSNAVVYGSDHAPVTVRLTGTADGVEIEVRNAGPAIPPELLNVIFDPLRRGMHEQTDKVQDHDGLGLGLYIAREIAKAHGGDIRVASGNGETAFTVQLPRVSVIGPA